MGENVEKQYEYMPKLDGYMRFIYDPLSINIGYYGDALICTIFLKICEI